MRFFNRGRTSSQRGFVLTAALLLAVLYFGLMELLLLDASRSLQEAQRFRGRIIAGTLAESAAELSAAGMIGKPGAEVQTDDAQGVMVGKYVRNGCCSFELSGQATTKGVPEESATVSLQGRFVGTRVVIDYSVHSQ